MAKCLGRWMIAIRKRPNTGDGRGASERWARFWAASESQSTTVWEAFGAARCARCDP